MTIASFLSRRRRVLAICVASALLHLLVINWIGAGPASESGPSRQSPSSVIVAQLSAPEPSIQAAPAPAAAPPPPPETAPRPQAAPVAEAAPVAQDAAPETLPEAQSKENAPAQEAIAATASAPASEGDMSRAGTEDGEKTAAEIEAEMSAKAAAQAQAEEDARAGRYMVSLPPSAELTMDVARTDASGSNWSGRMDLSWKQAAGAYTMKVEASISMLVTRVILATLTSEGSIDPNGGIVPRTATESRRGKAKTATHFDSEAKRITFSASEASAELRPGAQDKATVPLQLAGIGRADSAQLAAGIEMLVGEDKDATTFSFVLVGEEVIDTPMGKMATWHVSRPPRPGSYNSRLDVWLAPAHNWYPVRIRNTEGNGAVTTQTIRKIVITDVGH